jgi:hypothetical protein
MFGMYFLGDVNTSSVVEIILAVIGLRRPLLPKVDLPKALLLILLTSRLHGDLSRQFHCD